MRLQFSLATLIVCTGILAVVAAISATAEVRNENYVAEECVSTFRRMKLEQRIEELKRELAIAEREQDVERVSKLSAEQIQLSAQRQGMLQPQNEAASRIR